MLKINYEQRTLCPFGKPTLVGSEHCIATKYRCGECYSNDDRKKILLCTHKGTPLPAEKLREEESNEL